MSKQDTYQLFEGDACNGASAIHIRFLGSGDAFGSGNRMQPCIFFQTQKDRFLLDCGATAMNAMNLWRVDPNRIDFILVSHLHGDHFGGIPFFVIQSQLVSKRTRPLLVAGPPGLETRIREAMENMFPGSSTVKRKFSTDFLELEEGAPTPIGSLTVTPRRVVHACGAVPYAFRIECEGRVIAYSGDTEWTPGLMEAARGADLFICEAYYFDRNVKFHMNYETLKANQADLACKRIIITHMSNDMLSRLDSVDLEVAEDGKRISV